MALGKLVQFEKRREAKAPTPKSAPAEILIFTGVRYQRDTKTPDKPNATTPTRSKRKRG